jgi:hypothetical protein
MTERPLHRPAGRAVDHTIRAALLLGLAAFCLPGCAGTGSTLGGQRLNAVERVMWSTYPLASRKGMGTGFVVACRDARARGGVSPVVVTSVHVLATVGRGPLMLGARVPDERGEPQVAVLQFQPPRGRERFYVRHPHQDLAAFALQVPDEFSDLVSVQSFLDESALGSRAGALRAGAEVSFLGFPEVLPGTAGAFPILRTGHVASYPLGTAAADGLFVVNADVYPGDSGAPVFASGRGGRPELVGMIIRRVGTDERKFSHLAIAVDAKAIRETLQLVVDREHRGVPDSGQNRPSLGQGPRSRPARGR